MRLVVGGLLLGAVFLAAVLWQRGWTADARAAREAARSADRALPPADGDAPADGWGRIVVGRPSGAEPYATSERRAAGSPPGDAASGGGRASGAGSVEPSGSAGTSPSASPDKAATPAPAREFVLTVQRGQTLSAICKAHYGSARREIVDALARYNAIGDLDQVREGRTLKLPPIETLLTKRP